MLMHFRVLDSSQPADRSAWLELWHAWRQREVMAHPEYVQLFTRPGDRTVCVVGGGGDGRAIVFPLILRPLAREAWAKPGESRWDASTPYGYGGAFAIGPGPWDAAAFWGEYAAWCRAERLVSTFVRLSLFPEQLAPWPWTVEDRLPNIVVPLGGGVEAVRANYDRNIRKGIQKAEAAGLVAEVDSDGKRLDAFFDVYTHTMQRRAAERWYYFSRDFFRQLFEGLRGQSVLFHVLVRGEVVSSDLVLCSAERVYYFLGGTLASYYPLGPNCLLKHSVAAWAVAQGKKQCVLGGGYELGDGVFRYKRGFARNGHVPFRIGWARHDEEGYADLVGDRAAFERQQGRAWTPRPHFFPAYRG